MQRVSITGNLTRDAEVRTVGEREQMVFTVACSERGREGEAVTFYRCFGQPSGRVDVLKKGNKVYVEGTLTLREQEREGRSFLNANIHVSHVETIGYRRRTDWELDFSKDR